MGVFSKIAREIKRGVKKIGREAKRITKQVTSLFVPAIPEQQNQGNESQGVLINFESNNAAIPVIYGERKVGGVKIFKSSSGTNNEFLYIVLVLCEGEVDSIGTVTLDDIPSTDSRFSGKVTINKHLGTDDQAADSMLTAAGIGWTTDHRLRGIAYLACRFKWDTNAFQGEPKIQAVVKGRKVLDVRTSTTAWSDNAALCLYDYLTNTRYGKGLATSQLDTAAFQAAADDCDESVVPFSGGPARARFRCNAVIDTGKKITDNVRDMLVGMRGLLPWSEGVYSLKIEGSETSALSIGESHVVGELSVSGTTKRERFNRVIATFTNPNKNWQDDEVSWPDPGSAEEASLLSEDNNFVSEKRVRLRCVTDLYAARDIAKFTVKRSRSGISTELVSTSEALEVAAGDVIDLTHSSPGWTNKDFRVAGMDLHWNGEVGLGLIEYDPTLYAWEETTEESSPPATNFPDPFKVDAPSGLSTASGTEHLFIPGDGTVISRILVSWTAPVDAFVTNYELEFKKSTESEYTRFVLPGSALNHYIMPVEDGATYDIRIRSVNIAGSTSGDVSTQHVVAGKSERPPDVTTFTVARLADGTRQFDWTLSNMPADVRVGGGFKIKYQTGASISWSTATELHTGLLLASPFETNQLAAGQYTFGIKAVDSSGNESANVQTITFTLGDPRLREVLVGRIESALGWPGTKTDCFVNFEGFLEAVGATVGGQWDDLPASWSLLDNEWHKIVDTASPITYETPEIDLGIDLTFNPLATMEGEGTPAFKMKTGTSGDGSVVGSWVDLEQVQGKRYFQLQMTISGTDPLVTSLILLLDGERELDEFEDVNVATANDSWFERIAAGHFKVENRKSMAAISMATIRAMQNVGSGFTWELISKNTTITGGTEKAVEFKIYNSSGTLTDATVDVELRGPKAG